MTFDIGFSEKWKLIISTPDRVNLTTFTVKALIHICLWLDWLKTVLCQCVR